MGVGTGANQLMVLLDLHLGAPIFPNRGASPNGEKRAGRRKTRTDPTDPLIGGNETVIQKIQARRRKIIDQEKAHHQIRDVGEPGPNRFPL